MTAFQTRVDIKTLKSATTVTLHENKKNATPFTLLTKEGVSVYRDFWKLKTFDDYIPLSFWECYSELFVRNVYNLQIDLLFQKLDSRETAF